MKSLLLYYCFLIVSATIYGQRQPKEIIIKGSSSLTNSSISSTISSGVTSTQTKLTQFNFNPQIGVFLFNYFQAGLYSSFSSQKAEMSNITSKSKNLTLGPYLRAYLTDTRLSPFIQGFIGLAKYKSEANSGYNLPEQTMEGSNYGYGCGLEYFVKNNFSIESQLEYSTTLVKSYSSGTSSSYKSKWEHRGWEFKIGISIIIQSLTKN